MKRNTHTAELTKNYIESKVSQESILSIYLDIPIDTIKNCIENNKLIKSVFRNDDNDASMGIIYNNKGKLKIRDFGGFFFGDVYDAVAYVLSIGYNRTIDTNNKEHFYFVLKHIYNTFIDSFENKSVDPVLKESIKHAAAYAKQKRAVITVIPRQWTMEDIKLWSKWGIELSYLNTNFVVPVYSYSINKSANDEPNYFYEEHDPCYAYVLGKDSNNITLIKLYFPLRKRYRGQIKFVTNCNIIEGLLNIDKFVEYDYIVITKSSKDRLALGNWIANNPLYGGRLETKSKILVLNLPSENYKLKHNEFAFLKSILNPNGIIISLLDFDNTGRAGASYMKEAYNIPYIFITRGEFGLPDYKAKDFSDLVEFNGLTNGIIKKYIIDTYNYVNNKYAESTRCDDSPF